MVKYLNTIKVVDTSLLEEISMSSLINNSKLATKIEIKKPKKDLSDEARKRVFNKLLKDWNRGKISKHYKGGGYVITGRD